MTRARRDPDRRLAQALAGNARAFREMAQTANSEIDGSRAYFLAIAIELALKAYLLQRGITDDWNRGGHKAGHPVPGALVSGRLRGRTARDADWAPQASGITQPGTG